MKTSVWVWFVLATMCGVAPCGLAACSGHEPLFQASAASGDPTAPPAHDGTGGEASETASSSSVTGAVATSSSSSGRLGPVASLPRAAGEPCEANDQCASGSCDLRVGVCRASRGEACREVVGCAKPFVCAPACPEPGCDRPICRPVEPGAYCASSEDCEHGAVCGPEHLCRWPRGARCEREHGWCAGDEICCVEKGSARCLPRRQCVD